MCAPVPADLVNSTPCGWLETSDVGGELSRFDYDGVGQLIKLTRPDASFVSFEYDPAHRLTAIVQQDGARLTYTLDPAGNRTQEEITGVDGSTVYYTHRREFDALGRLWKDIGALNQTVTKDEDLTPKDADPEGCPGKSRFAVTTLQQVEDEK